jgi:hypothetical protein
MSMSTPDINNVTDEVTSGNAVETVPAAQGGTTAEPKFTAEQVERKCPERLREIGKLIAARLEKIDKQIEQAENHSVSVNQLITQAKELCDEGGFEAFREKFFPNLGKSRVYELLAIGTGKKSIEEIKANTLARVKKHREKKADEAFSVTVTENSVPDAQGTPVEHGEIEAPSIASEPTPEPAKPRKGDQWALADFSRAVHELVDVIRNKNAEHFAKASVSVAEIAALGKFLTDVANLNMSGADVPVLPGNGAVSAEQSPEDMGANRPLGSADLEADLDTSVGTPAQARP